MMRMMMITTTPDEDDDDDDDDNGGGGGDGVIMIIILKEQERIKKASPYTPYSIGNSSGVIFRTGIKLPRALRGCFVEVSHD